MDYIIAYGYLFLVGITFGSFFNVVGLRVPNNESIVKPRSACPTCHHTLTPLELIPIVSYLLQKGTCKSCGAKISPLYPIVEFMTGVLFAMTPLLIGWNMEVIVALTLISLFMIIFVSDLKYMMIPNKILAFFAILFVIERLFIPLQPWWDSLAGAALGFGMLLLIAVLSKGGMGGGDIKLFAVIGYVMGMQGVLLAFFFSCFSGAIIGIILMIAGKAKKGKPIPFGPFICVGTLFAYFFGEQIIDMYMQFL